MILKNNYFENPIKPILGKVKLLDVVLSFPGFLPPNTETTTSDTLSLSEDIVPELQVMLSKFT